MPDRAILEMVSSYGGCTTEQIRRRHASLLGGRSACYLRIGRLRDQGYLAARRLPLDAGIGSGRYLLTATGKLRQQLPPPAGETRSRSKSSVSLLFARHHLAVGDFRVSLELACVQAGVDLLDWTSDVTPRRAPVRVRDPVTGSSLFLAPDGSFVLRLAGGAAQRFHLEVDRGTMSAGRLKTKLRGYLALGPGEAPAVLFVVPHARRASAIVRWAEEEAKRLGADPTVFWVAVSSRLDSPSVLTGHVWRIAGGPMATALLPADAAGEHPQTRLDETASALGP